MSRLFHRRTRWITSALILSLNLAIFLPPASAAETNPVSITNLVITEIPDSQDPSRPAQHLVRLVGEYRNTTANAIPELDLDLVTSGPIRSRSELGEILADSSVTSGQTHDGLTALLRNVQPNQIREFQITFIGEKILGTSASGVFAIGALPTKNAFGPGSVVTTPWFYNSVVQPTNVVFAVQLATLNTHLANGEVLDADAEIKEAQRLTKLLSVSGGENVSWLLDPALPDWTTELIEQTDSRFATELSEKLDKVPASTNLLPFAHSDLAALLRVNQDTEAQLTLAATQNVANGRSIYYAPTSGFADRKSISSLADVGVQTIISNVALRSSEHETVPARVTASTNSVLVYDAAASNCLINAPQEYVSFAQKNCLQSEIAMITAESPQASRSIIVMAPTSWNISPENFSDVMSSMTNKNWVSLTTLNSIPLNDAAETLIGRNNSEQRTLSKSLLKQSDLLALNTETVSALFDDPELASGFTKSRLVGFSDLFTSNSEATKFLNRNYKLLNEYMAAIQIEASTRITTPNEVTEIPITVVNNSDKAVSVSISLSSNSASRFQSEPTGIVQVDKGQRVTVPVPITLIGAGIVDVRAQLVAPNGERFGEVQNIQISSTAYSAFARTLVWGAFGLLTLLSLSNFWKRRKARLANKE